MIDWALLVGVLVACFVAYNIGGATTGPAFGPAVGADVLSKTTAAALMSVSFFAGAFTIGRRVVDTLGEDIVTDPSVFTLEASIVVLGFIGLALLVGNITGVPASTSMTAVGAIAGLAVAGGVLNRPVLTEIVSWWILGPVIGFWVSVMIGRYLYPHVDRLIAIDRTDEPLVTIDRTGSVPKPAVHEDASRRELVGAAIVVGIGCLMAFSSGASNIANAIAPLVGSGQLAMNPGIVVGSAAVAVGAFTIARRTMESLGNDITDLPLTAAIIVAVVSSTIVVFLSAIGIPVQFVIIATLSIVGLGWGRATRTVTIADAVRRQDVPVTAGGLQMDAEAPTVGEPDLESDSADDVDPIGEESPETVPAASDLFDLGVTARIVVMQSIVPVLATIGCYLTFEFVVFA
ncbi:inorganic phosphate transporter [Natrarchaeobaculum aegyptiacum]|uniref:Phosphate transporter n=1 Tax=Natrarchaeobaculum aegyptiacum TaxID=745377 RepID=A0A2Z2HVF9_9EURY|nr:inorganic phosphate transporter [Natrarchaeobaculum aegyptiacum]ARS89517.1 inorganic phosphate transporter [Natrarchaeobaculum aegyptiacum]